MQINFYYILNKYIDINTQVGECIHSDTKKVVCQIFLTTINSHVSTLLNFTKTVKIILKN